ncbi:MAG: FixH family protein [Rickettsiales bacterium]|nr:FixH family protein [Rickettsiales bacterium]
MINEEKILSKKSKIPYFFFAFFGVVLAVDICYIYISQKTWRGVIEKDSYHQGLHYEKVIEQAKKQKELGWNLEISYKNLGKKSGQLEVFLQDQNKKEINDAIVTVDFVRPIQDGDDFSQELKFYPNKNGSRYFAKINFPLEGQWIFVIKAVKGSDNFLKTKRYIIQ